MTREVCGCCWVPIELCEKNKARTMTNEELIAEWESAVAAEREARSELEAAVLAEREACAKVCETDGIVHPIAAAAIRARGDKP